jgi:LmbE family N-acetylglucosaminyl deacetylase
MRRALTRGKVLVVAPHPDDEVLGAGGTLLRRKAEGATLAWLIVTSITTEAGWGEEKVKQRAGEIDRISALFGFDSVFQLNLPTTQLDQIPMNELVAAVSNVFKAYEPEEVFVPHPADVHTDHRMVFDAVASCTKWFRYPSVKRVLAYETLSETDFCLSNQQGFRPNVYVNIESYLDAKLQAMAIYESELGEFPFPRCHEAIRALATLRGAASGFKAAEAFELLRERL